MAGIPEIKLTGEAAETPYEITGWRDGQWMEFRVVGNSGPTRVGIGRSPGSDVGDADFFATYEPTSEATGLYSISPAELETVEEGETLHGTVWEALRGRMYARRRFTVTKGVANQVPEFGGGTAPGATLVDLSLSASSIDEDAKSGAVVGSIQGAQSTSSIALSDTAGGQFAVYGRTLVVAGELTAGEHTISAVETPAGNPAGRRITTLTVAVGAVVAPTVITQDTAPILAAPTAGATARSAYDSGTPGTYSASNGQPINPDFDVQMRVNGLGVADGYILASGDSVTARETVTASDGATESFVSAPVVVPASAPGLVAVDPLTVEYGADAVPATYDFAGLFSGGTPPYTFEVIENDSANVTVSGSVASLDASTGYEASLRIRATDSTGASTSGDADLLLSFLVFYEAMQTDGTAPTTIYMIEGQAIDPVDLDATITGGSGSRTWGGGVDLEPGLTVSAAGVLSGAPDVSLTPPIFGVHWTFNLASDGRLNVPALDPAYTVPAGHTVHRDLQSDPALSNVGSEHTAEWFSGFEPPTGSTWYFKLHLVDAGGNIVASSVSDPLLIEAAEAPDPGTDPTDPDPAPSPTVTTTSGDVDAFVDALPTTAGRTSTATLQDPASGLPTGWNLSGGDIDTTQDNPDPLIDYDLSNYRIQIKHSGARIEQCWHEDTVGVDNNYYIQVQLGGHNFVFRRNTWLGFDGFGGPGKYIDFLRDGSGAGVYGARDWIFEDNRFERAQGDYLKIRTGGLCQRNFFGMPVNAPPGTEFYSSSKTYSAGDFVFDPVFSTTGLYRAKVTTTGNAPPETKDDDYVGPYWQVYDPHGDHITCDGMTGKCVIRYNYIERTETDAAGNKRAIGLNNGIRIARNNSGSYVDCRVDEIEIYGNRLDEFIDNSSTIQVSAGADPNWNGPIAFRHNRIGSNGSGHFYGMETRDKVILDSNRDTATGDPLPTEPNTTTETTLAPNLADRPPFWGDYRSAVTGSISLPDFTADIPSGANVRSGQVVLPWINSRRHLGEGYGRVRRDVTAPNGAVVEMRGEDEAGTPTMWQWTGTKASGGAEEMELRLPEHTLAMKVRARINNHSSQTSDVTANAISVGPVVGGEDQSNGSRQFQLSLSNSDPTYIPPELENLAYVTWGDHGNPNDDDREWSLMVPVNNDTSGYNGGSTKVSASAVEIALTLLHETGGKARIHIVALMYSGTSAEDMLRDDVGGDRDWFAPHGDTVGIRTVEQNGCTFDYMSMIHFPPQRGGWEANTDHWFIGIGFGRHRDTGAPLERQSDGNYSIKGNASTPREIKHLMSDEISGFANLTTKMTWSGRGYLPSRLPLKALTTDPIWKDHTGYVGQISGAMSDGGGHFAPNDKDGSPRYGSIYWSYTARAAGITNFIVPTWDHVRWTSSYIELWSDAGPITCLRAYRGGSVPYVTGLEINGSGVNAQLVGGRVRINGSYGPGDKLTYGELGYGTIDSGSDYDLVCGIEGSRLGCYREVMPMDGLVPQYIMAHPGGDR